MPGNKPEIPSELWMLFDPVTNGGKGGFVLSIDDAPGGDSYLVCLSEDEADAAASHQIAMFDLECYPVRVK